MLYDFSMNTTVNEGNAGDNLGKSGFLKIRREMGKPAGEGEKRIGIMARIIWEQ